jgi:hypothetical protein
VRVFDMAADDLITRGHESRNQRRSKKMTLKTFDKDMRRVFREQISSFEASLKSAPFRGATKMRRELAAVQKMQQRYLAKGGRRQFDLLEWAKTAGLSHDATKKILWGVGRCIQERHPPAPRKPLDDFLAWLGNASKNLAEGNCDIETWGKTRNLSPAQIDAIGKGLVAADEYKEAK